MPQLHNETPRELLERQRDDLLAAISATDHIRSCSANNLCRDYLGRITKALRNLSEAPGPINASIIAGRFGPNGYGPGIADAVAQAKWWAGQYPKISHEWVDEPVRAGLCEWVRGVAA